MARGGASNKAVVIKKVVRGGGEGHHGGAWKVAYADFVTAMMAFFLLLWLLNVTTDEQKAGIADYFTPTAASRSTSGAGGMLGGLTISAEGAKISNKAPPSVVMELAPPPRRYELPRSDTKADDPSQEEADAEERKPDQQRFDRTQPPDPADVSEAEVRRRMAEMEERNFIRTERRIREAMDNVPSLKGLKENLMIDQTPEGLRIQLVDKDGRSMFPRGGSNMQEETRLLLHKIAEVVSQLPNRVAITGHTDSVPFRADNGYGNWELSADRANASRRALAEGGLPQQQVARVVGKADTEPLVAEDPTRETNRRISIVLLREALAQPVPGSRG